MITVVAFIFVFGLLVISHEMGHFLTAKLSGIKVMEFSFGMGPKLFGFGKKETKYSLRAFPIGGFVKMLGEEEYVNDPRSFSCKPTLVRMSVIAAGPFMNILVSILIFASIAMVNGYVKPIVSNTTQGYPAKAAGITSGDKIVKVNDKKIITYEDFLVYMYQNGGKTIDLTVKRQNSLLSFKLTPLLNKEEGRYMVGIEAAYGKASLPEGILYGAQSSWSLVKQIAGTLSNLIIGKGSAEDLSGPVGIIKYTGEAAKQGMGSLLFFTALLSINLAIINLVPFPALDGGWLLLLLIEGIRRKKLDADKVGVLNFIGFALLMLLTVIVTFRDIIKLY